MIPRAYSARRGRRAGVRRKRRGRAALALLVGLAVSVPCSDAVTAQAVTGTIAGRVLTSEDSAVAGATVLVEGTLLSVITDRLGRYRVEGLSPGRYTVRVEAIGFARQSRAGVEVGSGGTTRVDFRLSSTPLELPDIQITASRVVQEPGQSTASVAVLGHREIAQRDVTRLSEALDYAPGVSYRGGTLDIRGAAGLSGGVASRVLLMLDGHPLLTGDTGETDFDVLPVLGVQRIEIVKGPYSALYGSNALGGVVNIISSPIPDSAQTIVRVHAGAYDIPSEYTLPTGTPAFGGLEIQQSLRLGSVGLRLYGDRDGTDGFTQNGRVSRWLGRVEAQLPLFGGAPSSIYVIGAQQDVGEFFGWRSAAERFAVPPADLGDWYRIGWIDAGATLTALSRADSRLQFKPYVYYDAVQNHYHDNREYHSAVRAGSSVDFAVQAGARQSLTVGGDASYTSVSSSLIGSPAIRDYALFAQDEIRLARPLKASVGARLDDHSVTPGHVDTQLSPKIGLVYHVTPAFDLRASVSRAFRAPSPVEQFVSTTQYGVQVVPNPDLRPETETAGEIGATVDLGRVWVDGALFQSRFRGLIEPGPVPGRFFVYQFQNVARARITGLDTEVRLDVVPHLVGLDLSYMYLHPWDLTADQPLPYRSAHSVTGTASVLGGLLDVDVQFRSRVERVLQFPVDPRGSTVLVGLRAAYRLHGLLVQAKVSNLLQEQYVDLQERFPGAPRSFELTLSRGLAP